jgi:hypothetical protein
MVAANTDIFAVNYEKSVSYFLIIRRIFKKIGAPMVNIQRYT